MVRSFAAFGIGIRGGTASGGGLSIVPLTVTTPDTVGSTGTPATAGTSGTVTGGAGWAAATTSPSVFGAAPTVIGGASPSSAGVTPGGTGGVMLAPRGPGVLDGALAGPSGVTGISPLVGTLTPRATTYVDATVLAPGIRRFMPSIEVMEATIRPPPRKYPVDVLKLGQTAIRNGQFVPIMDAGISAFRPEIIAVVDFAPIWRPGAIKVPGRFVKHQNSEVGDFINIQFQASHLRQETLVKLIENVQKVNDKTKSDDTFNNIRTNYANEIRQVEGDISNFKEILQNIDNLKMALEIKKIPKTMYNTSHFLPLEEFFDKKMQYSKAQYESFADTKLMLQILFDLRSVLEGYSISLTGYKDPDREGDFSPVKIDKTYTVTDGFTFTVNNLRSLNTPINASDNNFFNQFVNSLPQSPDDRIKILTTILSKEYLVSKALGKQDVQRLLKELGAGAEGNPFDNIIGEVGNTIFEPPSGPGSLASLMYIDGGIPNAKILPFENKYVDSDDQKFAYVPGSAYFIDTILSVKGAVWNTGPFVNYINTYNSKLKSVRTVIENIYSLDNIASDLSPQSINTSFLNSLKTATAGLLDDTHVNNDQATVSAIFKLASTDSVLKNMLFQFCLLVGMAANSTTEQKEIFDLLAATEMINLSALSYLQIPVRSTALAARGLSTIRPFIDQLARAIETRVSALTTRVSVDFARIMSPIDLFSSVRPSLTSARAVSSLSSGFATSLIGSVGTTSSTSRASGVTTVQISRGSIARILTSFVGGRSSSATTFIKEFVDLSTKFFKSAQVVGASVHLLQDKTNRTRFNFLSPSTQLLILFEILCSYAAKYSFASFERSNNVLVSTIKIDTVSQRVIKATIDQINKSPERVTDLASQISTTTRTSGKTTGGGPVITSAGPPTMAASRVPTPITGAPIVMRVTSGGPPSTPADRTSALYARTSSDVAGAFHGSSIFGDIAAHSGPRGAADIRDLATVLTDPHHISRYLAENDRLVGYRTSLLNNRQKIVDETTTIANFLHILVMIGEHMNTASTRIQTALNKKSLETFLKTSSADDLNLLKNPSQVRTATYLLQNLKDKTPATSVNESGGTVVNNLVISDVVTQEEYRCFTSLMSDTTYKPESSSSRRLKILSVGIPSGFSKQLADRVNIGEINKNSFKDKEFDVVAINVYRRDARFDDIILKPQRFLFDLSLFPLERDIKQINPDENETFDRLILRAKVTDLSMLDVSKKVSATTIANDPKYDFLQSGDSKQMIKNHLVSYFLSMYVNFITGIRITEDVFINKIGGPTKYLNPVMQSLVLSYLKDVKRVNIPAGQTTDQLLLNPAIDDESKDIIRLFTFGSLVFNQGELSNRVLVPKLFDRIFFIPLDIDNFEVDEELTLSTESGKRAWRQTYIQNSLVKVGNKTYLKPRGKNDLIFEDYFIAIETANDRETNK